jgi:hypothetical protein
MGWWWRESEKSNKPSKPPGMYKNGARTASFLPLLTLKNHKTRGFLIKSIEQNILLRHFLRNTLFIKFFMTSGVVELCLFKFTEVIYAPSRPD